MNWLINAIRTFFQRLLGWVRGRPTLAASGRTELTTESKDPIAIQFCHDVNKVSRLLDFLIEEGLPYHIPDDVIEKIEAARGRVSDTSTPDPAQRAELLKAYRDLVAVPGTAVLFDFPPTPFWHSGWRAGFVITALIVPLIYFVVAAFDHPLWHYWYFPVGFAIASALLTWGLYVFTGIVTNRKLNHIIAFCYSFTLLMLVASLAPWWFPQLFPGDSTAPVSLLRACVVDQATPNDVPKGVACPAKAEDGDGYQWVLNIGGVIDRPVRTGAALAQQPGNVAQQPANAAQQPGNVAQQPESAAAQPRYVIHGGLVVPLYVLVLALIGGAVSMTRRVPEYQRRAMSTQDALTNQQARESLVFQIMQVVSAPLIAAAAYYIVNPSNRLGSVVLGFGSGFASEPILLMIRGLVEKLSPSGSSPPAPISVRVDPATKMLPPGGSQQFSAHVTGAPTSEVTWLIVPSDAGSITQSGLYTAPKDEGKTVTITACSVADRTKCGNASITTTKAQSIEKPADPKPGG
jgi:hypothetical protein